jgi:hypothetical protein
MPGSITQEFAFAESQVRVEDSPAVIFDGLALKFTLGRGITVTVVLSVIVPA